MMELAGAAKTNEQQEALRTNEDYLNVIKRNSELYKEKQKLDVDPLNNGDFVWMFRRK